jgi:hypothetical protein
MGENTVYILSDLVQRLGPATEQEVRLELEGLGNEQFIAKGRRIGTPRLVKELARNYGIIVDWLSTATDDQKENLGFVGTDWLRIAAYAGHQAEIRHDALNKGESLGTATKHVRSSTADDLMHQIKNTRERFYTSLLNVAASIPEWKARVESAYATPDTQVPMTDALDAMCVVAEKMIAEPTDGMKIRLARNKITADAITNLRALATSARHAKREADAVAPAPAVMQSEVDVWDGMAISFFEQFVDAVEDAHRVDPAIPAPSIIGLRSWFGRNSRKNEKNDEPSVPETPVTG